MTRYQIVKTNSRVASSTIPLNVERTYSTHKTISATKKAINKLTGGALETGRHVNAEVFINNLQVLDKTTNSYSDAQFFGEDE